MVLPTYTENDNSNINGGPNGELLSTKPVYVGANFADYAIAGNAQIVAQFEDFLGAAVNPAFSKLKGSDGTAASDINVALDGTYRLTTGAGSTHTMAVNGSQVAGALNYKTSKAPIFEASVGKISALTSQSIFIGLCDATTLNAPFTRTTATTTANATNAVGFLQDAASTNAKLYAVSVNAGGTPQSTALNVDVDTAAFHAYRIEVTAAGNALFYIDGVLVATQLLAVATTAALAPTVEMFSEATSGSQTLDIDYIYCQQNR